jgi:succinate dehydrogenase/fumarate reductase flavoprotein subunit
MHNQLSRRSFVSGAAAGLAGAAVAGGVAAAHADEAAQIEWDYETEVLVCGYGAAGASSAIEAADNGAHVLIIEKAALPGGSMARCGGAIMGAGTAVQAALGVEDDPDALFNWVNTCVNQNYELCPQDIIQTYANVAGGNVDWLQDMCTEYCGRDLFEVAWATENENAQGNEATGDNGNGVTAGCLNAVGCEYDKFGISSEEAVPRSHWAHSEGGASNSGPELFDPLHENINAKIEEGSIEVMYETALYRFVQDEDGCVIGVLANTADGQIAIKATKGVMLATGGYCASDDMKMRFCQDALGYTTYMCYDCEGDGILAAMAIGADLYNMCNFYPIEVEQVYQYDPKYNDVYNSWLDMDDEGYMEVPAHNMAECHGGVRINTEAQVLDVDGNPIPHLYCSGNDCGTNIFGVPGNYPGCGCYVSFALAFGRIAGANLAAETEI